VPRFGDRAHPDAGSGRHGQWWAVARLQPQVGSGVAQIDRVVDAGDGEGLAQQPRTGRQGDLVERGHTAQGSPKPVVGRRPKSGFQPLDPGPTHRVDPGDRFDRSHEQGGRTSVGFGYDVQAVVHPVGKVHVGSSGQTEHRRIACGSAGMGVRGEVLAAHICLDLDYAADAGTGTAAPDQARADQVASGAQSVTRENVTVEGAACHGSTRDGGRLRGRWWSDRMAAGRTGRG
jgi:hypothetical protein